MRNAHLLRAAIVSLLLSTLGAVMSSAQTFQTLVDFNLTDGENPSDSSPIVRAANGNVYGTTLHGGVPGGGTVFQVTPSGAFNTLFSFCVTAGCSAFPNGVIVGSDGNLYGTTQAGGANSRGTGGTLFRLTPSGTLTTLYNFCSLANCADGSYPQASPVQGSDGNFYGTTGEGGTSNYSAGTVYRLSASGGLTTLHSFCSLSNCSDGDIPTVMLQGSDGDFYGITLYGGNEGTGAVFKITPAGVLTTLYSFCSLANCADGAGPSTLIEGRDGNFYGTTLYTGLLNRSGGTVFQLTPSGTLTTLYSFCALANCADGSSPNVLVQGSDGNFYGTASSGGTNRRSVCSSTGCGTFFQLTRGGVLTTLYNFCSAWGGCTDGESPTGVVQTSGHKFLGTTFLGGNGSCPYGCGTIWNWSPNVALAPTFTPSSLSFGGQAVNTTSAAKSVTVKNVNTGSATLDFSNFSVNPPFAISSNTCGATLAAGKTCMVKVTFTPTVLGTVNGALSVADNAPGSPQTVPLTGTGIAQATVTPTSLTFGTVKVGKTSGYKNVTLKNNLPTTLTGISYATTGPFAVSGSTCSTTLASEHSCTISVTFSPTTIGPASGLLNVTDSANNSPQAVSLSGTGD